MNEQNSSKLTPEQSADVIRYYHDSENARCRENGWKDKVPLGKSALHTINPEHSLLSNEKPMLTTEELVEGLDYIDNEESLDAWPVQPTPEQWQEIERVADVKSCPIDEAYFSVMGIKPRNWK